MSELITETKLRQLAGEWIDGGKPVVGPVRIEQRALYQRLQSPEALLLESIPGALRPACRSRSFWAGIRATRRRCPYSIMSSIGISSTISTTAAGPRPPS